MFKETKSFQTHKPIQPKPNTPLHTLPYLASQTDTQETGCVSKIPRERQKTRKNNNPYFLAKFLFIYLFLNTDTLHRWPERNIQLLENEPEARRDPMPHHLHLERQHRREQDRKQMANKVHPLKGRGKSIASVQEQ